MEVKPLKNDGRSNHEIARDLLRFTTERLPRYRWFTPHMIADEQGQVRENRDGI